MKYLFLFLLISTTVFSQNYHYAIDEAKGTPTSDTTAPTTPLNLVVSNITQSSAYLNWTASTDNVGVVIYRIYNNGVMVNSTDGPSTSYSLTGLNPATDYKITVRAVDATSNESTDSNEQLFVTKKIDLSENQPEEIVYFDCFQLPIGQKSQLQSALDTYGCVRLDKGDYSGITITMKSNQSLYGHPSQTITPNINITAGSTNVYIESIWNEQINFLSGAPITNCILKSIKWSEIVSNGGMLENNLFIHISSSILFDMSASGYYRNNRVYRHQRHIPLALSLKGNSSTPSYGNIHVWNNYLTPRAEGAILDNIESISFLGGDSEGWNGSNLTTNAMLKATNMGTLKITDFGGGNGYCPGCERPAWDIQANNLFLFNKYISNHSPDRSIARTGTNVFSVKTQTGSELYNVEAGGIDFRAHPNGSEGLKNNSIYINNTEQTSTITNPTILSKLTSMILGEKHKPISRYKGNLIPDPLGANWETERIGKPDSRDYIQNLINTNTIAQLPEGIYYIGSTLTLNGNDNIQQGIIGSGTGKTVICGLTDDFPLITVNSTPIPGALEKIHLSFLTLQGGSTGLYFPDSTNLVSYNIWKYLVFRNQSIGIHFYQMFGFDNNHLEYVNFINCGIGIYNNGKPLPPSGTPEHNDWLNYDMGYMDKNFYYRCQFINNGIALQLDSSRSSGGNTWMECKFDGNKKIASLDGNAYPIFANCDFINNAGESTVINVLFSGEPPVFYSSNFTGNTSNYIFNTKGFISYDSNFLDSATLNYSTEHFDQEHYAVNSTFNGLLGGGWRYNSGSMINSVFRLQPELSKLFVNIEQNKKTTVIDIQSDPYPQFLVTH